MAQAWRSVCARAHWSVTSLCLSQYIFMCVSCTCVYVPSYLLCIAQHQYLSSLCEEDRLEGDLRINAILKQNTTCQNFQPSLPHGDWTGWFSRWQANLSPWTKKTGITMLQLTESHFLSLLYKQISLLKYKKQGYSFPFQIMCGKYYYLGGYLCC